VMKLKSLNAIKQAPPQGHGRLGDKVQSCQHDAIVTARVGPSGGHGRLGDVKSSKVANITRS
jgi:hypothetical protein